MIRFVINSTLGDKASGRIAMQICNARSPSSSTPRLPALPNNYSSLRLPETHMVQNVTKPCVSHTAALLSSHVHATDCLCCVVLT